MADISVLMRYFPSLTATQQDQFERLFSLYAEWNERINVISRKDIENLYVNHVLHSLAIAKAIQFRSETQVLDAGTGGGFPGIPLAVMFPETRFHLVDSIGKKIKVVQAVAEGLGLKNVQAEQCRMETMPCRYDFVVSRAVTAFPQFYQWVKGKILSRNLNELPNGIWYLKGGEVDEEMKQLNLPYTLYNISEWYEEPFFETNKLLYVPK